MSSLLAERVTLRLSSVDRIFVAGYVPQLQTEGQVVRFLLNRGYRIPSPAGLGHNHERVIAEIDAFVADNDLPLVTFAKRQRKEDVARPFLAGAKAEDREGVVLVGKAQERVMGWRGFKDGKDPRGQNGHPHFVYRRQALFVNHYYFYVWDRDWGPAFFKFCPYAPYPMWVWCNGHEWAKAQLGRAGVGFEALDNGFRSVEDPDAAQAVCDRLGADHLRRFLTKWIRLLPSPFIEDDAETGCRYDWSVRQVELSDTAVFDRPASGRAWFEAAIRDHLDLGRPERVSLIFDRLIRRRGKRPTPGRFATEVITPDVDPHIQIRYRASKVKAYFKEQRALRVETTINDPYDFGIGRRLTPENWQALCARGNDVNARFLAALGEGQPEPPDATTLSEVVLPSQTADGLRAPGMRFGDPRVMALLASVAACGHAFDGITNAALRTRMTGLWQPAYSSAQATYDLGRLRRNGMLARDPGANRYHVTEHGRRIATLFTRVGARIVVPTLTQLQDPTRPPRGSPARLVAASRAYDQELDKLLKRENLAA
ncbi:MAG: hypothetical protein GEU71_16535 [Actinobacteria bacterium]|nr:hypothetical protein [Actinomycetota bacterium]